jgi:hypothetical protein
MIMVMVMVDEIKIGQAYQILAMELQKGRDYVVGSKSFRPDQLFKVTEIKQLCYFSTQSPFISTHFSTDTLTSP